jgi:hypothetical protein
MDLIYRVVVLKIKVLGWFATQFQAETGMNNDMRPFSLEFNDNLHFYMQKRMTKKADGMVIF